MQMTMKRCAAAVLAAIALGLALAMPQPAWADAADPTASVELKAVEGAPNKVDVYVTTNQVDARTMSLALDIKTAAPDYLDASFEWDEQAVSNPDKPSLLRFTDAKSADGIRMNLYAGDMVDEPFKAADARSSAGKTVKVGTVVLAPSSAAPKGEELAADVSVAPGDGSLRFAEYRGPEVAVPASALNASEPVRATAVGAGMSSSSSSAASSGADNANNSDILGETPSTNVRSMPSTGDQMLPLVITLAVVAVVAAAVIVAFMVRRKKTAKKD